MTVNNHCSGCEMSKDEVAKSYEKEDFGDCAEVVFLNCGDWYCHYDCLRDCH